jgi:hypothetical protein
MKISQSDFNELLLFVFLMSFVVFLIFSNLEF